jgi:hypothetical protein
MDKNTIYNNALEKVKNRRPEDTTVLAVSGPAQHGKDSFSGAAKKILEENGITTNIIHFADELKAKAKELGHDGLKDGPGRTFLQKLGSLIRAKDVNYWVDLVVNDCKMFPIADVVIIPDTRYPNEIQRFVEAGFKVIHIRVKRPNFDNGLTEEQKNHPSETALNDVTPDAYVYNDGTLEDFDHTVEACLRMLELY